MTKYTPKWFYLLITILIYLQGCEKRPQNIDVTEGYESIVEKLEDAIQYEKKKNIQILFIPLNIEIQIE